MATTDTKQPGGLGACDPSKKCQMCDQRGLPILPLRYSLARTDVRAGFTMPPLEGKFGAGVKDIVLPGARAQYTLRLARQGYLYVFNEARGEWKGYFVTEDAYLLEFDVHADAPPMEEFAPSCARMATSQLARFVTIPDPSRAGKVWFGYSEAPWAPEVLKRNRLSSERKKHMRSVDVKAWVGGARFDHTGEVSEAKRLVSEFAYEEPAAKPRDPSQPASQMVLDPATGKMIKQVNLEGVTIAGNPAFDFTTFPFRRCKQQVVGMEEWVRKASPEVPAMMLALNDPAGLTQDVSALIRELVRDFEVSDDRDWKLAAATGIKGLRKAIEDQAAAKELRDRRSSAVTGKASAELYAAGVIKMPDSLTAEQDRKARDSAWGRYSDDYSEAKVTKFEADLERDTKAFTASHLTPLATAFVRWYQSDLLRDWLVCNHHERLDAGGGAFTVIVQRCVEGVSAHDEIAVALLKDLNGRFDEKRNITMRALVLNDSEVAKYLEQGAGPSLDLAKNAGAWSNILKAFAYVDEKKKNPRTPASEWTTPTGIAANFMHETAGAIITALSKAGQSVKKGAASVALSVAVRYRMMALMGAVSGRQITRLPIRASEAELAHFIVEALSSGQSTAEKARVRQRVDAHLQQELSERSGARTATGQRNARNRQVFQWAVYWDDDAMRALRNTNIANLDGVLLSEEQLRGVVRSRAASFASMNIRADVGFGVVGLLLDTWNAADAFSKLDDEKQGSQWRRGIALSGALLGLTGTSVELTAIALERTAYGQVARAVRIASVDLTTTSMVIGWLGKMVGTLGAIFGAVVDGWKAYDAAKSGDIPMAILFGATALGGTIVALCVLFGTITAGVGFVIMIILAIIGFVGEYLINLIRDDKIEVWINMTPFGAHNHGQFESMEDQEKAYVALQSN